MSGRGRGHRVAEQQSAAALGAAAGRGTINNNANNASNSNNAWERRNNNVGNERGGRGRGGSSRNNYNWQGNDNNSRNNSRGRKGRGGGSSNSNAEADGFWSTNSSKGNDLTETSASGNNNTGLASQGSSNRFASACQQIQDSLNKYLENHPITELSDDEHEDDLEEGLLARVVGGVSEGEVAAAAVQHLKDALCSGVLTCLICIHAVKRTDETWSCVSCYSVLHLSCVQKWGNDSIYQRAERQRQQYDHDVRLDLTKLSWSCPACRHQYPQSGIPNRYLCYCEKTVDPAFDPWLLPHSCGERCGKPLQPECGHACLMLCHPGACAPCPVMVTVRCACGQSRPTARRCSRNTWTCGNTCNKLLSCRQHKCRNPCHTGGCRACPRTSNQQCLCLASTQIRPCNDPVWPCDKICGKPYPCGHHSCTKTCHALGECGKTCPQISDLQYCPCGKTPQISGLACNEPVPVCGDTCDKVLTCGMHLCSDRCHTGDCCTCFQYSEKRCRCGARSKMMQCSKELLCETKCKRLKDCRKHPCNKKCCVGDCPPCEQPCNKTLQCGNHKCASRCHTGPCYPCNITVQICCPCGGTTATVACGRERVCKKPRCSKLCTIKSKCHHTQQPEHRCHDGRCPACVQVCHVRHSTCQHRCVKSCHDNVPVKLVDDRKRAGPWEPVAATRLEFRKMACPPCMEAVVAICRGSHGVGQFSCSEARHYSCGKDCGRRLACSNHECLRQCHYLEGGTGEADNVDLLNKNEKKLQGGELEKTVARASVVAGANCPPCSRQCEKVPVPGCNHLCTLPCHPATCPLCEVKLKLKCHCAIVVLQKKCREWTAVTDPGERDALRSCGNPCYKLMSCSHGCLNKCHSGACSDALLCQERVPVKCPCGRKRKEIKCSEHTRHNRDSNGNCKAKSFGDESTSRKTKASSKDGSKGKTTGNNEDDGTAIKDKNTGINVKHGSGGLDGTVSKRKNTGNITKPDDFFKCDAVCHAKSQEINKGKEAAKRRVQEKEEEESKRELEEFERRMAGKRSRGKKKIVEEKEEELTTWQQYKVPLSVSLLLAVLVGIVYAVI